MICTNNVIVPISDVIYSDGILRQCLILHLVCKENVLVPYFSCYIR